MLPKLYIVVPCYNEQEVLPMTSQIFIRKLEELSDLGEISPESRVLFVNDGSRDSTWDIIDELSKSYDWVEGISLSRNCGHQNALLAGLMYAKDRCDVTVSIDADGQDDINAIDEMIKAGDYIIRSLNDYYDAIGNKRIVDYALNPDANGISYRYKFSDGTIKDQYWKLGELFNILYNSNWACYRY